jgi:hypothetical protein
MRFLYNIFNVLRFNRRNWKAVVLCVFTAMVFWFFNALNKTYTTNISFPLSFEYDDENFIAVDGLPQNIPLNVTGNGWELFKRSTGVKTESLEIPLERPGDIKKIVGPDLKFSFTAQLGEGLLVNQVLSDTLYLDLEPKAGRWVKVAVDSVQYNIKAGYGLASEIAIIPDSTFVEGPKRLVEKIKEPVMLTIPQRNLDEHYVENIEVELPYEQLLTLRPPAVSVMFNVEEMITMRDSIGLALINIPASVSEVVNSGKVPVTLSVPERFAEDLNTDSLTAVLDLRNFKGGKEKILPRVEGLPPFSSVLKIDSVIVSL